jgi:hypothetical protein
MANNRAEFPSHVRQALAARVNNHCCFPGPSAESDTSKANTGIVCHIVPATQSARARRNDPNVTAEQRAQSSNGIYMCRVHGKLIDDDEVTFTTEMLKRWREVGELRTQIHQQTGIEPLFGSAEFASLPLAEDTCEITVVGEESKIIGELLKYCATEQIWGAFFARAARDLTIEVVKNALERGGAKKVTVTVTPALIQILDDGVLFNPLTLPSLEGRGGRAAVIDILDKHAHESILTHRYSNGHNVFSIGRALCASDVPQKTECVLEVVSRTPPELLGNQTILDTCSIIYVKLPRYASHSEAYKFERELPQLLPKGKQIVFILEGSSDGVKALLAKLFPTAKIMSL